MERKSKIFLLLLEIMKIWNKNAFIYCSEGTKNIFVKGFDTTLCSENDELKLNSRMKHKIVFRFSEKKKLNKKENLLNFLFFTILYHALKRDWYFIESLWIFCELLSAILQVLNSYEIILSFPSYIIQKKKNSQHPQDENIF